jgi:hypothetical protein
MNDSVNPEGEEIISLSLSISALSEVLNQFAYMNERRGLQ